MKNKLFDNLAINIYKLFTQTTFHQRIYFEILLDYLIILLFLLALDIFNTKNTTKYCKILKLAEKGTY